MLRDDLPPTTLASDFVAALRNSRALLLTGAGMSTDSGIPDYRGPDGQRRVTPMQYGEFVGSLPARQRYWARSYAGWSRFAAAAPNEGHRAVARLQAAGHFGALITQNVDGLHQEAGSTEVIELHGSLAEVVCLDCGHRLPRSDVQAVLDATNPGFLDRVRADTLPGSRVSSQIRPDGDVQIPAEAVAGFAAPICPECRGTMLKPDVVFFGESVPPPRVAECFARTEAAPMLVVLGSSLAVMSGLRFVRRAAREGIPIAIITRRPTRGDELATWRVDAPLTPTLTALEAALSMPAGGRPAVTSSGMPEDVSR